MLDYQKDTITTLVNNVNIEGKKVVVEFQTLL